MSTQLLNHFIAAIFLQVAERGIDFSIIAVLLVLVILMLVVRINAKLKQKSRLVEDQVKIIAEKNKKLEEQNSNLIELNEEKNNIIGVVSHDLKAPLNRIFALSNLMYLSKDNLNKEQRDYLDKMNQVVKEGLNLIRNMLDIRALEHKGIQIKIEKIDFTKLIQQMIKTYKSWATQKKLKIVFVGKNEPLFAYSDKQYLHRIFDNLISNAIKYSPINREIRIVLSNQDEEVVIKVEDDGWGISEEDQKKLFQKFVVLSSKPTGGESSTGLGLSIAKHLVEILKGQIYYEMGQNNGASFVVKLPLTIDS